MAIVPGIYAHVKDDNFEAILALNGKLTFSHAIFDTDTEI